MEIISLQMVPLKHKGISYKEKINFGVKGISCHAQMSTNLAIPSGSKTNFYEVLSLGTSKNVSIDEIKKAYRFKALKFHPDSCPHDESNKEERTRRFIEIKMAYDTLADPISRERYDYELSLVGDSSSFSGRRYGGCCMEDRRAAGTFAREIWERQLSGLRTRSKIRMEIKNRNTDH